MSGRKPVKYVVDKYVDDVLNDRVLACVSVKGTVERYLKDIERQGTEAFPFVMSENIGSALLRLFPSGVEAFNWQDGWRVIRARAVADIWHLQHIWVEATRG
jgi:hypothetical protein